MRSFAPLVLALVAGCAGVPRAETPVKNLAIPVRDPSQLTPTDDDTREDPPDADPTRAMAPLTLVRSRLANGAEIVVAPARGVPLVEVRLVMPAAGSAGDGERTGLAAMAGALAVEGGAGKLSPRDVAARRGALPSPLTTTTTRDATILSLGSTREGLDAALDLLATIAREPKLDPAAVPRIVKRMHAEKAAAGRGDAAWIAAMLVHRELFKLPASVHPYASFEATAAELDRLPADAPRAFVKQRWVPSGATIVVAGDVDAADARTAVEKAFGPWKGSDAPTVSFTAPVPADGARIVVADLPGAATAEITVATLGTERTDESWPALDVAAQLGEVRLTSALRDVTPFAARARVELVPTAHGPGPWVARATAEVARSGVVAAAMLDDLRRAPDLTASDAELSSARRRIEIDVATRLASLPGLADALARAGALRSSDDVPDRQLARIRALDAAAVQRATRGNLGGGAVLIVVGDAARVAPLLVRLGDVTVTSPDRAFERVRTLPADPKAPLEVAP
jgi:predicted Zn-dependent peptidase